ncbi:MAG: nucleoside triphosphate pyrophosphohydrolase [Bacillota bacterium]
MTDVVVVGLGPGGPQWLPARNLEALKKADRVFLRTQQHPIVAVLRQAGISFEAFDQVYERASSFEEVYLTIAEAVVAQANQGQLVALGVPGSPFFGEAVVPLLRRKCEEENLRLEILSAPSFLDPVLALLGLDASDGLGVVDALAVPDEGIEADCFAHLVFMQVYNRMVASSLKLKLMSTFDSEHPVDVIRAAGVPGEERWERVPLWKLDRLSWIDHLTCVHLATGKQLRSMHSLVRTVAVLRGEHGCPWDRAQDHYSLRPYVVEEAYEVVDAVNSGDMNKLKEELGDLLLQVVLHAQLARERGSFSIHDVIEVINRKMIRRHPHVFGSATARTSQEVLVRWNELKKEEVGHEAGRDSLLGEVPRHLPALMQAMKVQEAAARVGFDWPSPEGPRTKVLEELGELDRAFNGGHQESVEAEAGDVLFSVVNYLRQLKVDPEVALRSAVDRFVKRFQLMEGLAKSKGMCLEKLTLEQLDQLWEQSKKDLRS